MTLLVIVLALALLAVVIPLVGADSRVSGGWSPSEPNAPLWTARRI